MTENQLTQSTVGVVAICRNEERDLPGFLEHLLPWVHEIILVDDGSTDRTIELAKNAGSKVTLLAAPRQGDEAYSSQRNKGIAASTSDWLLHLDIDERVTPKLREEILQAIRSPDKDAYSYHRLNFFLHRPIRGGNWAFYRSLRFARRDKIFGRKIHEKLMIDEASGRIGRLKSDMWHYNEPTYEMRLKKSLNYTLLEAEVLLAKDGRITLGQMIFRPLLVFIKTYVVLFGFRDGIAGLILSLHSAISAFNTYVLAWDAQNRIPRKKLESEFAELT
jgi:(heptosyl)LPS beta-1,4-glucosyltransferase